MTTETWADIREAHDRLVSEINAGRPQQQPGESRGSWQRACQTYYAAHAARVADSARRLQGYQGPDRPPCVPHGLTPQEMRLAKEIAADDAEWDAAWECGEIDYESGGEDAP